MRFPYWIKSDAKCYHLQKKEKRNGATDTLAHRHHNGMLKAANLDEHCTMKQIASLSSADPPECQCFPGLCSPYTNFPRNFTSESNDTH